MSDWSLARALAAFVGHLRARGVGVSPAESADALTALTRIRPTDESAFAAALRTCLAKSPRDRERFDAVYAVFWHARAAEPARAADADDVQTADDDRDADAIGSSTPVPATGEAPAPDGDGPSYGASAQQRRMRADLAMIGADEREAMQDLIRTIGRRMASRAARRWRIRRYGALDMRASLRAAITRGGEVFELKRRLRKRERPRLVVLADVSYSMDAYSVFFLCFAHAFAQAFRSVESFVFSTRLSRVTQALARGRIEEALARLPDQVADWAGGTRIASSIETYLARHAGAQLDRNTVVMIVSDGWDTDEPARLHAALARLRARCAAIIWLDPLLGHPRYFTTALGVQHESPHVDICAPAANLEGLAALADRLSRERLV